MNAAVDGVELHARMSMESAPTASWSLTPPQPHGPHGRGAVPAQRARRIR